MDEAESGVIDAALEVFSCGDGADDAFFDMGIFLVTGKLPTSNFYAHNTYKENNPQ